MIAYCTHGYRSGVALVKLQDAGVPGTQYSGGIQDWTKEIDPSYAEVVDPLMKDYKKYLPTRAELAAKGLKSGSSYTVPCWIQESTTVISKD